MLVTIVALLLVLGIAYGQLAQGFYSALITAVLAILCAVAAMSWYETLSPALQPFLGAYADAASLLALFLVPLLALRMVLDRLLGANVVLGVWINRALGGAAGLVTGIVLTGILLLAVQMLPLGSTFLGYAAYDDALQPKDSTAPFHPDRFVAAMTGALSAGALGGEPNQRFTSVHDDLVKELFCSRNRAEQRWKVNNEERVERVGRNDTAPGMLAVAGAYEPTIEKEWAADPNYKWVETVPREFGASDEITRVIVVRAVVDANVRDSDSWWRLPGTQFRLLATRKGDGEGSVVARSHYPVGFLTGSEDRRDPNGSVRKTDSWKPFFAEEIPAAGGKAPAVCRLAVLRGPHQGIATSKPQPLARLTVDWVYRIGADETPQCLIFRRAAVANVGALKKELPPEKDALVRLGK